MKDSMFPREKWSSICARCIEQVATVKHVANVLLNYRTSSVQYINVKVFEQIGA